MKSINSQDNNEEEQDGRTVIIDLKTSFKMYIRKWVIYPRIDQQTDGREKENVGTDSCYMETWYLRGSVLQIKAIFVSINNAETIGYPHGKHKTRCLLHPMRKAPCGLRHKYRRK